MEISTVDIHSAYIKLKSYIYEDNTLLHLRVALAEYENDGSIDEKLKNILTYLESRSIEKYLEEIRYLVLPKKISVEKDNKEYSKDEKPIYYSNALVHQSYNIEDKDFNIFIDCPIELHIISVLWIMYVGEKLDKTLDKEVCGYRLARNSDDFFEENGYKLFQKYHEKYSYFRDSTISKALELHKLGLDVSVINLDIKRFFYHIKFDFKDLNELANEYKFLNSFMNQIHSKFQNVISENNILEDTDSILPIGLLSSSVVANYVLKDFDEYMVQKVKPEYYTRYVDDILLVLSNSNISTMEELIKKFSCVENSLSFQQQEDGFISFHSKQNKFLFQQNKVKILEFKKDASISLLKKFKKTIESNRSALNFLPEEKNIFSTLDEVSLNINYSSTINKISSIEQTSLDILSISKNLTQMIKVVLVISHKNDEIEKYNEHLKTLFAGKNLLELSKLWEKLFLYLILSRSFKLLKSLFIDILKAIHSLNYNDKKILDELKNNLLRYLANSLLMSASLDKKSFNEYIQPFIEQETKDLYTSLYRLITTEYIDKYAKYLIESNLIRQYYIRYPLLSYTNDEKHTFTDKLLVLKKLKIEIEPKKLKYSPRFIHYHEVLLFEKFIKNSAKVDTNEIFEKYSSYNKLHSKKTNYPSTIDKNIILVPSNQSFKNLKIGMANINVNPKDSIDSMMGKANLSYKRLNDIYQVLNMATVTKCDLIIFPEISIPIYWLQEIVEFSKRNEIAVIFGLEHFSIRKNTYNYAVTILPFRDGVYKNVYVDFELKSLYSPEEKKTIEGYGYKIPKYKDIKPKVFKYKNNYFSVFNCYELTEIGYRASLVGKVDFVVAIEHNKDTNYFSNIVGSVARDVHAYIIQVNDSKYGDSRITQPSKTEEMDIAKIKGGEDVVLLTSILDVKSLRNFQQKSHILQDEDKRYKLTPPRFDEKCNDERFK